MRRVGTIALLSLVLVALVGLPATAARPDATFHARSTDARQGGRMLVMARVAFPRRGTEFRASAVVHFACTDLPVDLVRFGGSYVAGALVPVAGNEAPGDVEIVVSIHYGDRDEEVPTISTIRARRGSPPPTECQPPAQDN